jgi:hypothetical protein
MYTIKLISKKNMSIMKYATSRQADRPAYHSKIDLDKLGLK